MSYSRKSRYSRSPSFDSRSVSRSPIRSSRSWSRSRSADVENPGNNLYVTGLSPRISKKELEKYFSNEGKVVDVHLVVDPWTRESCGFGFVTMSSVEEADRCIKYLDRSVLEGRVITVEKALATLHRSTNTTERTNQMARRKRGRTPTPGRYLGLRTAGVRCQRSGSYSSRRSPYSIRSSSPSYSQRSRSISHSPPPSYHHSRRRSRSPYSRSPAYDRRDSDRSHSPYYESVRRGYSTYYRSRCDDGYYRRSRCDDGYYRRSRYDDRYYRRTRYRSVSTTSISPRRGRSTSRDREYHLYHSHSRRRRSYSRSVSLTPDSGRRIKSKSPWRSVSLSNSGRSRRRWRRRSSSLSRSKSSYVSSSSGSESLSPNARATSRDVSRSLSPKSASS